jgi:hypothetical protein
MENYKIWTKHGEGDENLPKEASWDIVHALLWDTVHETV